MIREFGVENFMSISDRQTISFESTKDDTAIELLTREVKSNLRLNKFVILYGANASGKTNLLYAINTIWLRLFQPAFERKEKIPFYPFALSKDKPTELYISFYVGGIRYDYSIKYDQQRILAEKLEYAPNGVLSLFYNRTYVGEEVKPNIEFGRTLGLLAKTKNTFSSNTLNNHSVLSTYAKVSVDEDALQIGLLYNWIKEHVHNVNGDGDDFMDITKLVLKEEKRHKFIMQSLKDADFNIAKISIEEINNEIPENIRKQLATDNDLPDVVKKKLLAEKKEEVVFTHQSSAGNFSLDKRAQSAGTLQYFELLNYLYDMVSDDHIYMFDEIERGLHYDLLLHLLTVFIMNTNKSQIIITTQDQQLLNEDFIRRDMIWFAEKVKETAATVVNRASDFGIHKNASLYNAYRTGKLGAKPELGNVFINDSCCD